MWAILAALLLVLPLPARGAGGGSELPASPATRACHEGDDARSVNECGFLLFEREQYRVAVEHFARAVELDASKAAYANNLGAALLKLREPVAAEAAFRAALRSDPASAKVRYNLAVALFRQGRLLDALQAYRQAEAAGPAYTKARFEREEVQQELRKYVRENADNKELQSVLRAAAGL